MEHTHPSAAAHRSKTSAWRWILLTALAVALVALAMWGVPLGEWLRATRGWIDDLGFAGTAVFIAAYVIAAMLCFPSAPMTVLAGSIFGFGFGLLWASLASTTVAALAFLTARHVARAAVERKLRTHPRIDALHDAMGDGGWMLVLMLRLAPLVPFGPSNYAMGLTSVRFWPYLVATWVGMLPGKISCVYVGHLGAETVSGGDRSAWEWIALALGLAATIGLTVWFARVARTRLAAASRRAHDGPHEVS